MAIIPNNIYTYLDYRKFLKDYYQNAKKNIPGFSYRAFAQKSGVTAPNFLQYLIEAKRNLAEDIIPHVIRALELDEQQGEYFAELVRFNQAKSLRVKTEHFRKLSDFRKPMDLAVIEEEQFEHYNRWYNEAIRVLLKIDPFNPSEKYAYRKLGKKITPAITESQAKTAIRQLLQLGLAREEADGRIRQTDAILTTGDEISSFTARRFQETMMELSKEASERFPRERRDVSCITLTASEDCFSLIKKEIQLMRKRILELVSLDSKPDHVYQLNFQLFPLTPDK